MKTIYLLLILKITFSCITPESSIYNFDPKTLDETIITLKDIADDIFYIPLDNTFPIGSIHTVKIVNNSIYLATKDLGVMEFNSYGKFVRKIGTRGRGPGEYHYFWFFDIDPRSKSVYILDRNIIKVYNSAGLYQRSISLKEYGDFFHDINLFHEKLFISEYIDLGEAKHNWLIMDTVGILIGEKKNPMPAFNTNNGSVGGTYKLDDKIFYWNQFNDTVYSVFSDLSYTPSFLFCQGEHRWPMSLINFGNNISEVKSAFSKYLSISDLFETNRFIVIKYFYKKSTFLLIDKKSKKTYLSFPEPEDGNAHTYSHGGVLNNLDGGIDFQPQFYSCENGREYMFSLINPSHLKAHIIETEFIKSAPNFPQKKKELEKLANSLKETENPILMLVRLKK